MVNNSTQLSVFPNSDFLLSYVLLNRGYPKQQHQNPAPTCSSKKKKKNKNKKRSRDLPADPKNCIEPIWCYTSESFHPINYVREQR